MIPTMRVTEKGQVTIPKDLRDALGIGPGSEVDFERKGNTLVVRKKPTVTGRGRRMDQWADGEDRGENVQREQDLEHGPTLSSQGWKPEGGRGGSARTQ